MVESHVILGGGVAVVYCILLSAHHMVIFAIAQLSSSIVPMGTLGINISS